MVAKEAGQIQLLRHSKIDSDVPGKYLRRSFP